MNKPEGCFFDGMTAGVRVEDVLQDLFDGDVSALEDLGEERRSISQ